MAKTSYEGMIEVNSILNFYALGSVFTSERFYNTDFLAILVDRRLAFVPSIGDFLSILWSSMSSDMSWQTFNQLKFNSFDFKTFYFVIFAEPIARIDRKRGAGSQ